MKKIIHLSDLHFGTERTELVEALVDEINAAKPDIIVISGDLTQRARAWQYQAASKFLARLSQQNILCVPGNHDISLHNPIERFLYPFDKYKKYIKPELCNHITQDNISVLGINSVTPYKPKGGYVTDEQLDMINNYFQSQPKEQFKIVVMHHNLIRSERHKIINDAEKIINVFAKNNVNLVLCGHIHQNLIELLKRNYLSHNLYVVTAGTPISIRTSEANSFNIIEINGGIKVTVKMNELNKFLVVKETSLEI